MLRQVAALGASVVRVPVPDRELERGYLSELGEDEHELARALVGAVAPRGRPALVLCGDRSVDRGTGALPAFVAHELGAAQALGLVTLEPGDGVLSAERRLDSGWRERLRVPLPAVCSVEAAGIRLRRASLAGALAAEGMVVPVDGTPYRSAPDGDVREVRSTSARAGRSLPGPGWSLPRRAMIRASACWR